MTDIGGMPVDVLLLLDIALESMSEEQSDALIFGIRGWAREEVAMAVSAERERCAKKCDEYVAATGRGLSGDVLRAGDV